MLRRWMTGAALVGSLAFGATAQAEEVYGKIDFEGHPAGTILETVAAMTTGDMAGPIAVSGLNPLVPSWNAALIFDSANPTGGDFDLGTPNETFGGPGVGVGGEVGSPTQNDVAQGNLLVIAENFYDNDGDGLIDDPDDEDQIGMVISLDFSGITVPFVPENVRVEAVTILDVEEEQGEEPATAVLFGAGDVVLAEVLLEATGDNGRRTVPIGVDGVVRMEFRLNGSGAIDDVEIVLEREDEDECSDCEGGITELTLEYNGWCPAHIVVTSGWCDVIFCDVVEPGETFTLVHPTDMTLGTKIKIYKNGCFNTKIYTDCSQDVGPGLTKGKFTVVSGMSKFGGELCPYEPPVYDGCWGWGGWGYHSWSWGWGGWGGWGW